MTSARRARIDSKRSRKLLRTDPAPLFFQVCRRSAGGGAKHLRNDRGWIGRKAQKRAQDLTTHYPLIVPFQFGYLDRGRSSTLPRSVKPIQQEN